TIRQEVGSEIALGLRLSWTEFTGESGITPALSEEYIDIFAETGIFDYFSISCGGYHTLHYTMPAMGNLEDGYLGPYAAKAKEIVAGRAKIMVAGKIRSLALAEDLVTSGATDVVCIMRGQIADPSLVRKTREGRESEIVGCVGSNQCAASLSTGMVTCTVNPAAGRERVWGQGTLRRASKAAKVAVVGGGPGG